MRHNAAGGNIRLGLGDRARPGVLSDLVKNSLGHRHQNIREQSAAS
jgi:hypothetical protein